MHSLTYVKRGEWVYRGYTILRKYARVKDEIGKRYTERLSYNVEGVGEQHLLTTIIGLIDRTIEDDTKRNGI